MTDWPPAVKTFTFSVLDATGAVTLGVSFTAVELPIWYSFRGQSQWLSKSKPADARRRGTEPASHEGRTSTVGKVRALSNLDDVAVRIADVAADLAVLGDRRRDELGSSTFP